MKRMDARLVCWILLACSACTSHGRDGAAAAVARAPEQVATAPRTGQSVPAGWSVREDLRAKLPAGIAVLERADAAAPLRAWMVVARMDGSWVPEASQPKTGLRTTSQQAADLGALVAVNAGYFAATGSVSAVVDEGVLSTKGAATVKRGAHSHPVARAALGFDAKGGVDCAWTWCFGDALYSCDAPLSNAPGKPAEAPARERAKPWAADELVGAGPMLVEGGKLRNTEVEECFQGVGAGSRHPRTAAGWTKDGRLLLLVVDGRSDASRGATLEETAQLMIDHGAEEALNFDGGGSSTLWVAGTVVNRPSDAAGERLVASILALCPRKDAAAK